jgi:hypothetical protein
MAKDGMQEFLAECFWPGVTAEELEALDRRARAAASGGVEYRGSLLVPEDEVVFCFYGASSEQAVQVAAERAEIPFARIVESTRVPPSALEAKSD